MVNERPTWAEIDLPAIFRNVSRIKERLAVGVTLCAVVKADGYGHGAAAVARTAIEAGAGALAVAIVNEAEELRLAGFDCPILVMGAAEARDADRIVALGLDATVFELETARALSAAAARESAAARIHLKIDTGMGRIGCDPAEAPALARDIADLPSTVLAGAFSHFATADDEDTSYALRQLASFNRALDGMTALGVRPECRHMANSAAAIRLPEAHFDMVRLGIAMYGQKPSAARAWEVPLEPAMTLKTRVSMVKSVPAGTSVGYGRRFIAPKPTRVATLPLGYADGWPRALSGKASALVNGRLAPFIGSICMDQCMLDVGDAPGAARGDEAVLFGGAGPTCDDVAAALGTINYEVVCMVGKRVPRVYVG